MEKYKWILVLLFSITINSYATENAQCSQEFGCGKLSCTQTITCNPGSNCGPIEVDSSFNRQCTIQNIIADLEDAIIGYSTTCEGVIPANGSCELLLELNSNVAHDTTLNYLVKTSCNNIKAQVRVLEPTNSTFYATNRACVDTSAPPCIDRGFMQVTDLLAFPPKVSGYGSYPQFIETGIFVFAPNTNGDVAYLNNFQGLEFPDFIVAWKASNLKTGPVVLEPISLSPLLPPTIPPSPIVGHPLSFTFDPNSNGDIAFMTDVACGISSCTRQPIAKLSNLNSSPLAATGEIIDDPILRQRPYAVVFDPTSNGDRAYVTMNECNAAVPCAGIVRMEGIQSGTYSYTAISSDKFRTPESFIFDPTSNGDRAYVTNRSCDSTDVPGCSGVLLVSGLKTPGSETVTEIMHDDLKAVTSFNYDPTSNGNIAYVTTAPVSTADCSGGAVYACYLIKLEGLLPGNTLTITAYPLSTALESMVFEPTSAGDTAYITSILSGYELEENAVIKVTNLKTTPQFTIFLTTAQTGLFASRFSAIYNNTLEVGYTSPLQG